MLQSLKSSLLDTRGLWNWHVVLQCQKSCKSFYSIYENAKSSQHQAFTLIRRSLCAYN